MYLGREGAESEGAEVCSYLGREGAESEGVFPEVFPQNLLEKLTVRRLLII